MKARQVQVQARYTGGVLGWTYPTYRTPFAAGFIDIGLPVMDGYELIGHLKRLPGCETLRLIAVTGYGQDTDRHRAAAAGFDHLLVKPVDLSTIEQWINADESQ